MKFNYARYNTPGPAIFRPIIPVIITNSYAQLDVPVTSVMCEALVDSGADYCIFPSIFGEMIGIEVEKGTRRMMSGVVAGESRPVYFHVVDLSIEEGNRFEAYVGFMPDLSRNGHGILGRHSFFSHFNFVTFRDHKWELEIGKPIRGA